MSHECIRWRWPRGEIRQLRVSFQNSHIKSMRFIGVNLRKHGDISITVSVSFVPFPSHNHLSRSNIVLDLSRLNQLFSFYTSAWRVKMNSSWTSSSPAIKTTSIDRAKTDIKKTLLVWEAVLQQVILVCPACINYTNHIHTDFRIEPLSHESISFSFLFKVLTLHLN